MWLQAQQSRTLSEDEMLRRCSLQEYSLIKHRQKKQQLMQDAGQQQQQQAAAKGNAFSSATSTSGVIERLQAIQKTASGFMYSVLNRF